MLKNSLYARIVACATGVAMILPAMPVSAAPKATQQVRQGTDVVLTGGKLTGKLLNSNGKPVDGALVAVEKNGKLVGKTVTKSDGSYTVAGLSSGTHTITLADGQFPVRLWSKEAAPAAAKTQLTVSQTAVRGQFMDDCGCPVWGNIAVGAIAVTALIVALVALDEAEEAENQNGNLQAQIQDLQDQLDALQSP